MVLAEYTAEIAVPEEYRPRPLSAGEYRLLAVVGAVAGNYGEIRGTAVSKPSCCPVYTAVPWTEGAVLENDHEPFGPFIKFTCL